jgi:hypothetical protein
MRNLLLLASLMALAVLPGCSTITDFGIKGGPGFDINPFNLGSGDPIISSANDRYFADGQPQDCRTRH